MVDRVQAFKLGLPLVDVAALKIDLIQLLFIMALCFCTFDHDN
jgi:hypothetical protein